MAIFGRNANQQSSRPEVPPELRPYYSEQVASGTVHRTSMAGVLIPIILILIGAAAIGTGLWLRSQTASNNKKPNTTQNSQVATKPNTNTNKQASGTSPSPNQSSQTNPKPAPSPTPTPSPQPAPTNQSTPSKPTTIAAAPTPTPAPTNPTPNPAPASSAIPNTGPGTNILLSAIGTGLIGALIYHIRQVRSVRANS